MINFSIDLHTNNTQFALPAVLVQLDFNIQNDVYYVYFNGLLQKKKKKKQCLSGLIFLSFFFVKTMFGIHQLNGEEKIIWGNLVRLWLEANFKHFMIANLLQRIKETGGRTFRSIIN